MAKDKKWMQKVSASIKRRGTKGKCTPITKPGCTGRAKALAKTFKKIARERKAMGGMTLKAGEQSYIRSYISGSVGGVNVSNPMLSKFK